MNQMVFKNRTEFRNWLEENALSDEGVWLVFSKRSSADTVKAGEALEEALCFGWIDGQMRSIDDDSYIKYFKQRDSKSKWSEKNRKLAETLEKNGLMTEAGRAKIASAKQSGSWDTPKRETVSEEQMQQFEDMIKPFDGAYGNYLGMTKSVRRTYATSYFFGAKTAAGKQKRFDTIIERLNLNLNPMESMKKAAESKSV